MGSTRRVSVDVIGGGMDAVLSAVGIGVGISHALRVCAVAVAAKQRLWKQLLAE